MTLDMRSRLLPPPLADESAARRTLRDQIARLDGELSDLALSVWPHAMPGADTPGTAVRRRFRRGAALQSIADLERTRDALAARASELRRALDEQGARQEESRRLREELLLDPSKHRFVRVTNEAVGECGCRDWHVRPRFGLLGVFANWWRVVISSGCPLARRPRAAAQRLTLLDDGHSRGWCPQRDLG